MKRLALPSCLVLALLASGPARADNAGADLEQRRLDLSLPTIPAFTALGVSPSTVSRPGTVREFSSALANGVNPNGELQSGIAVEASPAKLLAPYLGTENGENLVRVLGGLQLSLATNAAVQEGGDTLTQAALGARWGLFKYDPWTDDGLARCLVSQLPPPLQLQPGQPPPVPTTPTEQPAPAAPTGPGDDLPAPALPAEPGTTLPAPAGPPGVGSVVPEPQEPVEKSLAGLDACRRIARAAHLATTALELAYVHTWATTGTPRFDAFRSATDTVWLSFSYGYNNYKAPAASDDAGYDALLAELADSRTARAQELRNAWAVEPLLYGRLDAVRQPTGNDRQYDVFGAVRVPVIWEGMDLFVEAGVRVRDVDRLLGERTTEAPFGLGGEVRLSNGTWLGLFAGADLTGNQGIFVLSNLHWGVGEERHFR